MIVRGLKAIWNKDERLDKILVRAFSDGLVRVYAKQECNPKIRLAILGIWKKIVSGHELPPGMTVIKLRAIAACCLQIQQVCEKKVEDNIHRVFMIRRYKIMHALAAERLGFYERLEVDKYRLSGLIVDYLNNFPSPSAEIK